MKKKKAGMEMNKKDVGMEVLPSEVRSDILSRLPVESLVQCRSVCKAWCSLIDDPFLRETHTKRLQLDLDNHSSDYSGTVSFLFTVRSRESSRCKLQCVDYITPVRNEEEEEEEKVAYCVSRPMGYPPKPPRSRSFRRICYMEIIGSCNGLVCLGICDYVYLYDICMFNPVTREYLHLPSIDEGRYGLGVTPHGFGYNPSTNEYKVVRIRPDRKIDVYTLGSGKWRTIGDVPSLFSLFNRSDGVLSYGAIHWTDKKGKIASFDLATDEFYVTPYPCEVTLPGGGGLDCHLGVWRRSLCLVEFNNPVESIQIWVMKNAERSWRLEIKMPVYSTTDSTTGVLECMHRFITLTETGNILFWYTHKTLISYDPIKKKFTSLDLCADRFPFSAVLHTKSFVSMKALGEKTRIIGQVQRR